MRKVLLLDIIPNTYGLDSTLPSEFRLFKFGINRAYHIGVGDTDVMFTSDEADYLMAMYDEAGIDLLIDYGHRSLNTDDSTASGWIKGLEKRDDGLYATKVEWTPQASQMLKDKEYRYYSPAVEFDENGKMSRLLPAALTNVPALKGIKALMNSMTTDTKDNKEKTMSDENVTTFSAADMKAKEDALQKALDEVNDMKINAMLDKAISEKKLAPAKKAEYSAHAKKRGLDTLELMLSALTVALPSAVIEKPVEQVEQTMELSDFQKNLCETRGYDPVEFAQKTKQTMITLSANRHKEKHLVKQPEKAKSVALAKQLTIHKGIQ